MKLPEQVSQLGFVGERKAVALLFLGFFATVFTLMGFLASSQLPEWTAAFFGLGACYGIGFFAVAADWFWGRWFAVGLGNSGLMMAVMALVATREILPQMVVFGAMHGLITLCLLGEKMAAVYEARPDWRQRFKLDEGGVVRVKHSVTRAATSLPSLILWALAPRDGAGMALLAVGVVGMVGLLRGRTWGVLAVASAGAAAVVSALAVTSHASAATPLPGLWAPTFGVLAGGLLLLSALPFARPIAAFLRR